MSGSDCDRFPFPLRSCSEAVGFSMPPDEPTLIERRPREVRKGASTSTQTFVTKVQRETTDDD